MAPKKSAATPDAVPAVLVDVTVLSRLDHDGLSFDAGDAFPMDLTQARPLRDLGVVDFADPAPEAPAA